jgi:hypothetical protein
MRKNECAGLDLENGRAVLVRKSRGGIETVAEASVGPGREPAEAARALLEELGMPKAPVVVGLGGKGIILKTLRIPKDVDPRWQVTEAPEGSLVRHAVLKDLGEKRDVLVAAVPKEAYEGAGAPVLKAGGKVAAADLRALAVWRAARCIHKEPVLAVREITSNGARMACGRETLEYAREFPPEEAEFEFLRTLEYYREEYGAEEVAVADAGESDAAFGLALHFFFGPALDFSARRKSPALGKKGWLAVPLLLLLAVPWALAAFYQYQAKGYEREAAAYAQPAAEAKKARAQREVLNEWIGVVESFGPADRARVLEDVQKSVPKSAWLTELALASEKEGAKGGVLPEKPSLLRVSGYAYDMASVGLIRDRVSTFPWCEGITLFQAEYDDKVNAYRFDLAFRYGGGGGK